MSDPLRPGASQQPAPVQPLSDDVETHERAAVRLALRDGEGLAITVDAPSGFVSAPHIVLQRENGRRTVLDEVGRVEDASGRVTYRAVLDLDEPYLDALLDVRGQAASGLAASAVEGFVYARYEEEETYELFGPGGALALTVVVADAAAPVAVLITTAPGAARRHGEHLQPLSEAFVVATTGGAPFPTAARLAIPAQLGRLGNDWRFRQPDAAIYRWADDDAAWSPLEGSSGPTPVRSLVLADLEGPGTYAVFAQQRPRTADDLRRENDDLRRLVVDQERELRALRARLDQTTQGVGQGNQGGFGEATSLRPGSTGSGTRNDDNAW